jgi:hypothetical protein
MLFFVKNSFFIHGLNHKKFRLIKDASIDLYVVQAPKPSDPSPNYNQLWNKKQAGKGKGPPPAYALAYRIIADDSSNRSSAARS